MPIDRLFARISVPRHHQRNVVAARAPWYTWSPASLRLLEANVAEIRRLPCPPRISVPGCSPYEVTYSYRLSELSPSLFRFAMQMSEALLRVKPDNTIRCFAGFLDEPSSGPVFHKCLALFRAGIVRLTRDPRTALHAPVKQQRVDAGFPLHADLFLTDRLWVIFDDVPAGRSGQTLFLPQRRFDAAVSANRFIPHVIERRLRTLLDRRRSRDSFDEWFGLVYSPDHPWAASLARAMRRHCWSIKFRRGEGYLLNDRVWLHGRTAVRGRVSPNRFRRLVYGEVATS